MWLFISNQEHNKYPFASSSLEKITEEIVAHYKKKRSKEEQDELIFDSKWNSFREKHGDVIGWIQEVTLV